MSPEPDILFYLALSLFERLYCLFHKQSFFVCVGVTSYYHTIGYIVPNTISIMYLQEQVIIRDHGKR